MRNLGIRITNLAQVDFGKKFELLIGLENISKSILWYQDHEIVHKIAVLFILPKVIVQNDMFTLEGQWPQFYGLIRDPNIIKHYNLYFQGKGTSLVFFLSKSTFRTQRVHDSNFKCWIRNPDAQKHFWLYFQRQWIELIFSPKPICWSSGSHCS